MPAILAYKRGISRESEETATCGRGLGRQGQAKMSKSDPGSAIFMEDSEAEVGAKIKKAFCPPPPPPPAGDDAAEAWNPRDNPCLEYVRMIVLPRFRRFGVSRKDGSKCAPTALLYI